MQTERGARDQETHDPTGDDSGHHPTVRIEGSEELADQRAGDGPDRAPEGRSAERDASQQSPRDGRAGHAAHQGAEPGPEGREEPEARRRDVAVAPGQEHDSHWDEDAAYSSGDGTKPDESEGNGENATRLSHSTHLERIAA